MTSAVVADLLDDRLVVVIDDVVSDRDVVLPELCVQPLHGEVTWAVIIGVLVVAEDEHGVLPPAECLLDPHTQLTQLLVGGACVCDCRIELEADGTGTSCHHGNVPVGGEAGDGRGGVVASGADEGPGVVRQLEVNGDQWRY